MPYSSEEGKEWMKKTILDLNPSSVLDIGAGSGTYFDLAAQKGQKWWAVEIWSPYIQQFGLANKYDGIILGDVRDILWPKVELTIFGDVLEHMSKEDALIVWNKAISHSRYVLLSIPLGEYPQGAYEGNEYEEHKSTWTHEECMRLPGVKASEEGKVVGTYLAMGIPT